MRKKLGINSSGGVLQLTFNEQRGELVVSKVASIDTLNKRISSYIKPGEKPVVYVDEYYQAHRSIYNRMTG